MNIPPEVIESALTQAKIWPIEELLEAWNKLEATDPL